MAYCMLPVKNVFFPRTKNPGAEISVNRAGAQGQIMSADARRKIRAAQPDRIARGEFDSAQRRPVEGEVLAQMLIQTSISDKRHVAEAKLAAVRGHLAIFAPNHRQIELYAQALAEIVADENLGR